MKATFNTREYERSHFKKPRGYGVWAFMDESGDDWMFSPQMTYTDAKAWAKEQKPAAREFTVGP